MKILHLATQDTGGGAANATYRLHCNMRTAGLDSRMMVLKKNSDDSDVVCVMNYLSMADKLRQVIYAIWRRFMWRIIRISPYFNIDSQAAVRASQLVGTLPFQPDVIVVHWVSGFVNAVTLRDLNRITNAPIIWYFMDMAAFTGGCHYAFDCAGYTKQCGNCPQLGVWQYSRDSSYRQWKKKRMCLHETNITAVSASSWLRKQSERSSIFTNKCQETILLGIDVGVFCPASREEARKQLDLPNSRKIIFFGAQSLEEERKGIQYLVEALRLLYSMLGDNVVLRDQVIIVTAGNAKNIAELDLAFEHQHIGFLSGDVMLAAGYQAADIFVNASIEDSGPMMINESILCGTPVVSFEMGVASDLVHTDKTGYRARLKDAEDMAIGLHRILEMNNQAYSEMRARCRDFGMELCHPDVQVNAFKKLFNELIADSKDLDR